MKIVAVQRWQLMVVDGSAAAEPAGHRLAHATPLPVTKFIFDDEHEAKEAARRLDSYVQANPSETRVNPNP